MPSKDKLKRFVLILQSLDFRWQIYIIVVSYILIMLFALLRFWQIGVLLLILLILSVVFIILNVDKFLSNLNILASDLSKDIKDSQENALFRSPIGIIIYSDNLRVRWLNPSMQSFFAEEDLLGNRLDELNPIFSEILKLSCDEQWQLVSLGECTFKVIHQKEVHAIYMMDVSEEADILQQRQFDRIVFGFLILDDYDEVQDSLDDNQAASIDADLIHRLNAWSNGHGIYIKRIDEERFILLMNKESLNRLEEEKFQYFNELREYFYARNIPLSASIGIAYSNEDDYSVLELSKQAQLNLELALGRGGDQTVIKANDGPARFYGGNTNPSEKRTNVRAKLVFQALQTSIQQSEVILISGHKSPDMDSIGSALGVYKLTQQLNKQAYIILNENKLNKDITQLLSLQNPTKMQDVFISPEEASTLVNASTLLILVDHHRPSLSEAESLLNLCDTVIIDHHRRSEDFPERVVLTYIEPYASSASEMITEFFMNQQNTEESLSKFEATALLAGIIVDTNNFASRTGSRTFDAASYLKSRGANTNDIQRILKEDYASIIQKNQLLEQMEIREDGTAITVAEDNDIYSNIIPSQTADMMLDIIGVEASFVIYRRDKGQVNISARSLGKINVQTIMEKLGGGGHLNNAATQIYDVSVQEAYQQLIEVIEAI